MESVRPAAEIGPLLNSGAGQLVDLLAKGAVSSVELTTEVLRRIDETQPALNAFRRVRAAQALATAAQADRELAQGHRVSLLGLPLAIKDDIDLAGEPTAFGCAGEFRPAKADCELVRVLKAAGAVIVGKTNSPELGQWPFTEGIAFGDTRNPWQLDHTPAAPPAARPQPSPLASCPSPSARTALARSASPLPGRTSSASNRSGTESLRFPRASCSTASRRPARWHADAPTHVRRPAHPTQSPTHQHIHHHADPKTSPRTGP